MLEKLFNRRVATLLSEYNRDLNRITNDSEIFQEFFEIKSKTLPFPKVLRFLGFPPPPPISLSDELSRQIKEEIRLPLNTHFFRSLFQLSFMFYAPFSALWHTTHILSTELQTSYQEHHRTQYMRQNIVWSILLAIGYLFIIMSVGGFVVSVLTVPVASIYYLLLTDGLTSETTVLIMVVVGFSILFSLLGSFAFYLFFPAVITRLVFRAFIRRFTEVVTIRETLSILVDLQKNDALNTLESKRILLHRMRFLAEATLLLPRRLSDNRPEGATWIDAHFIEISQYIYTRAAWIFAPRATTREDLLRDFNRLLYVFVTGYYGDFDEGGASNLEVKGASRSQVVLRQTAQILGSIIPIVLLSLYLINSSIFFFVHLDTAIVSILLVAWILLSIDSIFKLNVLKDIIDMAKGIRQLS